jgi:hypothetical protein
MVGYELPSVSSDVSALMPPASQGVERRSERQAGRIGFRWGLRALVVGGLAGAAWMLSGAAAHAADPASAATVPGGLAILSPTQQVTPLARGLGNEVAERTVKPVVKHATRVVVGPGVRSANRPPGRHATGATVATPVTGVAHQLISVVVKPANQLVTTAGDVVRSTVASHTTTTGVMDAVRGLTAPLRPTGGPVGATRLTPVTRAVPAAPLIRILSPVTDLLNTAVPMAAAHGAGTATRPRPATVTGAARHTGAPAGVALPAADPTGSIMAGAGLGTMGGNGTDTTRRFADARYTAATTARPDSVQPAPGSPDPVPLGMRLGAVSGIPASVSGSSSGGGSAATVPAAVAASTVACHRLPIATDVEVRRYDAESPTVSPD